MCSSRARILYNSSSGQRVSQNPRCPCSEWERDVFKRKKAAGASDKNLLTFYSLHMWGKLFHFTADAVLISTVLAGIKRNTGLQWVDNQMRAAVLTVPWFLTWLLCLRPALSQIENEDVRKYLQQYLNVGEWMLDNTVVYMNNSQYFERKD